MRKIGLALAIGSGTLLGSLATFAFAQNLPNGNGKDVVEKVCVGCHDLSPITDSVGGSRDDWDSVVQDMIAMGMKIQPQQVAVVDDYLAQNFPPKPKK